MPTREEYYQYVVENVEIDIRKDPLLYGASSQTFTVTACCKAYSAENSTLTTYGVRATIDGAYAKQHGLNAQHIKTRLVRALTDYIRNREVTL